jgi:hypothetical protein
MRVPVEYLQVIDGRTGRTLWEGKPSIGQTFEWGENTEAKFMVWSSPPTTWPPMNPEVTTATNFKQERPILDAMELQEVALHPLEEPDYWHRGGAQENTPFGDLDHQVMFVGKSRPR